MSKKRRRGNEADIKRRLKTNDEAFQKKVYITVGFLGEDFFCAGGGC